MSAMPIKGRAVKTIADLRAYLAEMEAAWSAEDEKYQGKFEDQRILVPHFEQVPSSNRLEFRGYGLAAIAYGESGLPDFVIDQPR